MRELAYLNAGIKISLTDLREKDEEGNYKQEIFYSEEGLKEFVRFVDSSREHLMNDVIYINTEKQGTPVEVAIMYNTSYNENIHSYVNNINTIEGGTHLAGFRRALTRTLKKYAEDNKMLEKAKVEIAGDDFREGIRADIADDSLFRFDLSIFDHLVEFHTCGDTSDIAAFVNVRESVVGVFEFVGTGSAVGAGDEVDVLVVAGDFQHAYFPHQPIHYAANRA